MGKKKTGDAQVAEAQVAEVNTPVVVVDPLAEIDELIAKRNEAAEFREYKSVKKIDTEIAEKVVDYNNKKANEVLLALGKKRNPMLEACKMLKYEIIKVSDKKQKGGETITKRETAYHAIDPLVLHDKVGGVGKDKSWRKIVEATNCIFAAHRAFELGIPVEEVIENYKMSDDAATMVQAFIDDNDPTKLDENSFREWAKGQLQAVVNAMTGAGEVTPRAVAYVLGIFSKKSTKGELRVNASNHKNFRIDMMDVCNLCYTGNPISYNFPSKKK